MRFKMNDPHSFRVTGLKVAKSSHNGCRGHFLRPLGDLKIKATDLKFSTKITCNSYI